MTAFALDYKMNKRFSFQLYKLYKNAVKILCVIIIFTLGGYLLAIKYLNNNNKIYFGESQKGETELHKIVNNPIMRGYSADNTPYIIKAGRAIEKDNNMVQIEQINAEITTSKGEIIQISSLEALLNSGKDLHLNKNVSLKVNDEYLIYSPSADIDLKSLDVSGNEKVKAVNEESSISAESFTITSKGNIIKFTGNVKVELFSNDKAALSAKNSLPKYR